MARGRLYLFEHEVLCTENRGKKRVFFHAPLKDLSRVRQVDPFYIGQLECQAFSVTYAGEEYMLGNGSRPYRVRRGTLYPCRLSVNPMKTPGIK